MRKSNIPIAASVKSAFSTFAPSKLVPVNTVFVNIAPFNDEPLNDARSTIAFEKSAFSKLLSVGNIRQMRGKFYKHKNSSKSKINIPLRKPLLK